LKFRVVEIELSRQGFQHHHRPHGALGGSSQSSPEEARRFGPGGRQYCSWY
jgi:hypothetical protein